MTEKIIIAAAISILTFLALAAILVVDSTDDVCRPIGLLLLCLVGASIILAKVEPRGGILCYVTVVLFYIHLVVQVFFFGETKPSILLYFFLGWVACSWLYWAYLQYKTQTKESARTFFYMATWFVFGSTLLMAVIGVTFLIVKATNVVNGSAVIEKEDILEGLETICFVVLAVSNWFVAMEDQIPISLEDNSDEHKKEEELQAYESMT